MKKAIRAVAVCTAIAVLVGAGYLAGSSRSSEVPASTDNHTDYPLLAKRLFLDNPNDTRINFSPLRKSLNDYYGANNLKGGVYFEFLPTGTSIRINGNQAFRAASLVKLPVAMELYKAKEQGKVSLDQQIELKQEWLNDDFGDLYKKGAGHKLTIGEAVRIMLIDSDNTALRAVIDTTDKTLALEDRALGSLDIEFSVDSTDGLYIGARSYASFLKCLYFACYNTKEDSAAILDMLTQTKFNNRIVAGINDSSVKIAHKVGVFNSQVQSDCGIIYIEANNFVLCVMLEGDDTSATNAHIAAISKMAYEFVAKNR